MRSFSFYRLFLFFVFILLAAGAFFIWLPSLISTEWGKKQVVSWINRSIPGQVEIHSLQLKWGKGQLLEGILLKDPEGRSVIGIEQFSTEATLWQLLQKSTHLGLTRFQELNAAIVTDEKGVSNLQKALGIKADDHHSQVKPSTILLSDVNANLYLFANDKPLAAHITGNTRQENLQGSFEIDVALNGLYAKNWDELTQDTQKYLSIEGSKDAKMHVKIVNFPVDLIDRLVTLKKPELNTLFHSLLGEKLNLIIDKEPSSEGLAFNLIALTPLMQGDVKGKKDAKMHVKIVNFPVDLIDRLVTLKKPELNTLFHSLLGEKLNLIIDKEPSSEGLAFNLIALTPLMQGDVKGKIVQGIFSLQEPAAFHFNLKPESLNPFSQDYFEILELTRLKLLFQELTFPLTFIDSESKIEACQFGFKIQTEIPSTRLELAHVGEIKIVTLKALLEAPLCDKKIHLKVTGQGQENRDPFDIHLESILNKPNNFHEGIEQLLKGIESSLKLSHFPLKLTPFFTDSPSLVKLAGTHTDLLLNFKQSEEENTFILALSLHTPKMVLNQAQFKIGKDISLITPLILNWTLDADCMQTLLSNTYLVMDHPCPLSITVDRFNLPLEGREKGRLKLESTIQQIQLTHLTSLGKLQFKDLILNIEGQVLSELQATLSSQFAFLKSDNSYSPLLNKPGQLNLSSTIHFLSDESLEVPLIRLQLNSPTFESRLDGHLTKNYLFELTQPFKIRYLLTPEALQELNLVLDNEFATLHSPTWIDALVSPTQLNFKTDLLKDLNLKGSIKSDQMTFKNSDGFPLPSLKQMFLSWSIEAPNNLISLDLKGIAPLATTQKPSQLSAQVKIHRWLSQENQIDLKHLMAEVNTNLVSLPTSFISALITDKDLTPLIGQVVDIDLKTLIDRDQKTPGYWDMYVDSTNLHAKARVKIDEAITLYVSSNPSAEIRWTLSPEGYRYLTSWLNPSPKKNLTLTEPFTLIAEASDFYFPLKDHVSSEAQKGSLNFDFHTTPIRWSELPYSLELKGDVLSVDLVKDTHFSFETLSNQKTLFKANGTASHLLDTSGKIKNWEQIALKINLESQNLPLQLVQTLLFLDNDSRSHLQAIIGESIEAHANLNLQQLTGSLLAEIKGANGQANLDGYLNHGELTLRKPFEWSIRVTPQLMGLVKENMPLLSSAISSEKPLNLSLDPKGFSCPLFPFDFNQINVERGSIDLGKIRFRNEGELSSILSLIKSIDENQFTIWFTPLYFQLNKSILSLKRIDLLVANLYTLASWGEIDLNMHKMNMILGLSAQSLRYAFNIQDLDEDYILQIPFRGKNGSVEIDKKMAIGRISALIAQIHGNSSSKLFSNVLEAAMSNSLDSKPPLPTTQPFPWVNEFQSPSPSPSNKEDEAETKSKNKKKGKQSKESDTHNILKDLEQGASGLIEKWIK